VGILAARLSLARRVFAIERLIARPAPPAETGSGEKLKGVRALFGWRARYILRVWLMARMCHKTLWVSHAVRDRLVRDYGYPEYKTVVTWNGVDVDQFSSQRNGPSIVREELGIGPLENVLLCVARLAREKGIDALLRALLLLSADGMTPKCLIVGTGSLRDELTKQSEEMGLSGSVLFVGFRKDVRPYFEAADLFVLPSYKEGLPLPLLEAMACGLPCVATDVGGSAETISHGREGWIVQPGSVEQLASATKHALSNAEERQRMGIRARGEVLNLFNIETTINKVRDLLLS
jgi:glycosyltransferase involved in cell wall biosynthesis